MKKILLTFSILAAGCITAQSVSAQSLDNILGGLFGGSSGKKSSGKTNTANQNSGNTGINLGGLSNSDITSGLKEALKIGAQNASNKLSVTDGFFRNAAIKILMPQEAKQVEQTLRSVGLGSVADKAILAMNRAAEDAAKQAAPIFINAITSMSIQDGVNILKGGNNAATNYLKGKTTSALTAAFRPVIQKSLAKVNATEIWNTVFSTYNRLPFTQDKVNPDLTGYVTERALSGIFTSIAGEELKIRTDPGAQVTNLLKKVFGSN